jgi:hypothetical protein
MPTFAGPALVLRPAERDRPLLSHHLHLHLPLLQATEITSHPMLRIRDVYPGSEFFPSRIRIKEFKYFYPKKWFLSSRKYDPGCSSRIRILVLYPSQIPDPGIKKALDPGSGSAALFSPPFPHLPIYYFCQGITTVL